MKTQFNKLNNHNRNIYNTDNNNIIVILIIFNSYGYDMGYTCAYLFDAILLRPMFDKKKHTLYTHRDNLGENQGCPRTQHFTRLDMNFV